jgi:hypothetical protein
VDWHENYAGQGGIIKETSTIEHLDDLFAALASLIKKVGRFLKFCLELSCLFTHLNFLNPFVLFLFSAFFGVRFLVA